MMILFRPNAHHVALPDEVIYRIFQLLTPLQVTRLRSVSKQYSRVSDDPYLWKQFYTNSCLPRPPGPFPWQSAKSLERLLVHSERLSHNWTTQAVDIIARTPGPNLSFPRGHPTFASWNFLLGRLFVWCQGTRVLAQDRETGIRQVLWESDRTIEKLDAHSINLVDSQRVYVAIRHLRGDEDADTHIKLLEFPTQETGPLLGHLTWEQELPIEGKLPFSPKSNSPLLKFERNDPATVGLKTDYLEFLIVDVQSRRLFLFPEFTSGYENIVSAYERRPWWPANTLLFGKFLINIYFWQHRREPKTHIQVFTTTDSPSSSDDNLSELRLTHESLCDQTLPFPHCLIRTIVSPATGGIRLSYLGTVTRFERTKFSSVTIGIPPVLPDDTADVEYLTVDIQDLFTIETRQRHVFVEASDNGYVRGLITVYSGVDMTGMYYSPRSMYKFSIDATSGEDCKAVVSAKYDVEDDDAFKVANHWAFDGVTGRLCFDAKRGGGKDRDLVVLDLK